VDAKLLLKALILCSLWRLDHKINQNVLLPSSSESLLYFFEPLMAEVTSVLG
jgi:hypothetical protein